MKRILLSSAALLAISAMAAPQQLELRQAPANGLGENRIEKPSITSLANAVPEGMRKAPGKITIPEGSPITEAPAGKEMVYKRDVTGFYLYWFYIMFGQQTGLPTAVVEGDDGYVYIYNPFGGWETNSYLKCERRDDKLVATLPQPIYDEEYNGVTTHYYAMMLDKTIVNEQVSYIPNEETEVVFSYVDGVITLDLGYDSTPDENGNLNYPEKIFGMADSEGVWTVAGDAMQINTPFEDEPVVAPEGLQTEEWAFVADGSGHFVNVGFDGNDVYLQGLDDSYLPDAWIKGTVEGDKVVFPSRQYLGTALGQFIYYFGSKYHNDSDWTLSENTTFDFDRESRIMTCAEDDCMIANAATDRVYYLSAFHSPVIKLQPENISQVPSYPIFDTYYDYFEEYGYNLLNFILPNLNENSDILKTDNMYYQVRLDGDILVLDEMDYPGLEDGSIFIPYNFSNESITANGMAHYFCIYWTAFDTVSLQLFNVVDGKEYASKMVTLDINTMQWWIDPDTSVETMGIGKAVKSVEFYTLDGVRVENPSNGIFIRKAIMEDGSIVVNKIVKR